MKTGKKHNGSLWARVALMLALMMVYTLSASAWDLEIPIDMVNGNDGGYTCDGGTITKSGSNLSITTNENFILFDVIGVEAKEGNQPQALVGVGDGETVNYNCYGWKIVKVTYLSQNVVVSFDLNGYGSGLPGAQNLTLSNKVTRPDDPSGEGIVFDGWFVDENCTVSFDFSKNLRHYAQYTSYTGGTNPHQDLTLYAKWLLTQDVVVTFDKNGHGGDVASQNLTFGNKVTKPADPSEEGFKFGGWFRDVDGTVPFDFETVLGANTQYSSNTDGPNAHHNLVLYARWLVKVEGESCGTDVTWGGYKNVRTNVFDEITISGNGEIAERAFDNNKNLRSVVINDGVTSIGQAAFRGCSGLTSVTIPASVTSIGQDAFLVCEGLTSVNIPASVTSIGEGAFRGCSGLTSVNIPASVTSIGEGAFLGCEGLTSVNIPASVTSIGQGAFYECTGLTSVTIPASVTSIGQGAFNHCEGLTSVTIYAPYNTSTSEPTLGNRAFENNHSGRNIYVLGDYVENYKAAAGWSSYQNNIKPITLSVNEAGGELGNWCSYYNGLVDVTVPEATTIYKAKLNGNNVTLTAIEGNIVKKGNAVLLKSANPIELSSANNAGEVTYSDNDLKGVDAATAQTSGKTYYVLSKVNDVFGFYKLADGISLGANKAFLEVDGTPGAREFIGFDEATEIDVVDSGQWIVDSSSDAWYTLDGRKLDKLPTRQGIYIHGARRVVIK